MLPMPPRPVPVPVPVPMPFPQFIPPFSPWFWLYSAGYGIMKLGTIWSAYTDDPEISKMPEKNKDDVDHVYYIGNYCNNNSLLT